jgi:hypothetical protein
MVTVAKAGTQKLPPKIKIDETCRREHSLESSWEHFPMVLFVFRFNHLWWENAFLWIFLKKTSVLKVLMLSQVCIHVSIISGISPSVYISVEFLFRSPVVFTVFLCNWSCMLPSVHAGLKTLPPSYPVFTLASRHYHWVPDVCYIHPGPQLPFAIRSHLIRFFLAFWLPNAHFLAPDLKTQLRV